MKTVKDYYNDLILISEEIVSYYIMLIQQEIAYGSESTSYKDVLCLLVEAVYREKCIYLDVRNLGFFEEIKQLVCKEIGIGMSGDIIFRNGFSHLFRLNSVVEGISDDATLDYVTKLKADINRILFNFITEMIDNPYYSEIKSDLIQYKYSLIFLNIDNEDTFINGEDLGNLDNLSSPQKRKYYQGYRYIDESLIELPCLKAFEDLADMESESFSDFDKFKVIIKIINILARFTLGDERLVSKYIDDITLLLEGDNYPSEITNIAKEMMQIFGNINSKIGNGRK